MVFFFDIVYALYILIHTLYILNGKCENKKNGFAGCVLYMWAF